MDAGPEIVAPGGRSAPPKLARESIADALREQIVAGALAGGQPLRQDRIAARFGVSAIPVREALRQLDGEGLVEFAPRRGACVARLSRREVDEICEMREALELLALDKAWPAIGRSHRRAARQVLEAADAKTDADLRAAWGDLNWQFHSALYRPADRPQLLRQIRKLHNQFDRYLRIHLSALDYRSGGQAEHWAILGHCERGERRRARRALRAHIRTVNAMLIDYIDREGQGWHAT